MVRTALWASWREKGATSGVASATSGVDDFQRVDEHLRDAAPLEKIGLGDVDEGRHLKLQARCE
jgi:hypothetical protein